MFTSRRIPRHEKARRGLVWGGPEVLGALGRTSRIGYVPAIEADNGWSRSTLPKDCGEFLEIDPGCGG
jgi:hypothetical protein